MKKLKTAVIGVGSLGQHHARILKTHELSDLVCIVDTDIKRAAKLAKEYSVECFSDHLDIVGKVEAVIVAVPTPFHYKIAKKLLEAKIHCLVEKPFTSTVGEAEDLIELSISNGLILQVGHVERFNPAVIASAPYIDNPKFIEVNRLGPYDPRTSHIGVVMDLMIHDIDIVLSLVKDKVIGLEAYGAKVLSGNEDIVKARLKFSRGAVADLSASRISLERFRKIRIFQNESYISIDYAKKDVKIYKKKAGEVKSLKDIQIIKPKIQKEDQLYKEHFHFLNCIIEGKTPTVSGEHGRDALELALEILKALKL